MHTVKSARKDIVDTIAGGGSFKAFSMALKVAGLVGALRGTGPFTVFAPTDEAFAKLDDHLLQDWLQPGSKRMLRAILNYHVVPGRMLAAEIVKSSSAKTVQGTSLTIRYKDKRMHVNNAAVVQIDIECDNGVIHVVDTVVIPR